MSWPRCDKLDTWHGIGLTTTAPSTMAPGKTFCRSPESSTTRSPDRRQWRFLLVINHRPLRSSISLLVGLGHLGECHGCATFEAAWLRPSAFGDRCVLFLSGGRPLRNRLLQGRYFAAAGCWTKPIAVNPRPRQRQTVDQPVRAGCCR